MYRAEGAPIGTLDFGFSSKTRERNWPGAAQGVDGLAAREAPEYILLTVSTATTSDHTTDN